MKLMIVSTFMAAMMGAGSAMACDCEVKACQKSAGTNAEAKKACDSKKGAACTCTDKKSCGCEKDEKKG